MQQRFYLKIATSKLQRQRKFRTEMLINSEYCF